MTATVPSGLDALEQMADWLPECGSRLSFTEETIHTLAGWLAETQEHLTSIAQTRGNDMSALQAATSPSHHKFLEGQFYRQRQYFDHHALLSGSAAFILLSPRWSKAAREFADYSIGRETSFANQELIYGGLDGFDMVTITRQATGLLDRSKMRVVSIAMKLADREKDKKKSGNVVSCATCNARVDAPKLAAHMRWHATGSASGKPVAVKRSLRDIHL
jgi:hypothetical protein